MRKAYSSPKRPIKPIIVLKSLKAVPNVAQGVKVEVQKIKKGPSEELETFPSTSKQLAADNPCCKEKQKVISQLTGQNIDLKAKYDRIVKAHDTLKTEYLLLERKYKEKMEECRKEHFSSRPPILSVSKYIELF